MENKIEHCLVTGASRGIGRGFVESLLAKGKTVVACVRDTKSFQQWADNDLDSKYKSKLIIVELESADEKAPWTVVEHLKTAHNIHKLDLIIANTGTASSYEKRFVADTTTEDMIQTMQVNMLGPMRLFQACLPLLEKSSCPRFLFISSGLGSIGLLSETMWAALGYGATKAAANYMTRSVHFQSKDIVSIAIHPGMVKTDMGDTFCAASGTPVEYQITIEDSVSGCLSVIFNATKETTSGCFMSYDGTQLPW